MVKENEKKITEYFYVYKLAYGGKKKKINKRLIKDLDDEAGK